MRFFFTALFAFMTLNCSDGQLWAQSLQEQEICAAQAKRAFQEENVDWDRQNKQMNLGMQTVSVDFESHYNAKINRCLMLVIRTTMLGKQMSTNKSLFDAIERREYGEYMWISHEGKKFWEVPPASCQLTPTHNETQYCKSEDEFKAFVAKYMEE
jgi:hypothetical protein